MATFSPCTQSPVDYSIIHPDFDRYVESHPFEIMSQGSISMTSSCDPDIMNLDEAMAKSDRGEFIKDIHKKF